MQVSAAYRQLKGFKRNAVGELILPEATNEDYENLVSYLLDELSPVIRGDVASFLWRVHCSYMRFYATMMNPDFIRPRLDEELNTKQILTLLKYYLYRRTYSHYAKENEDE